MRTTFLLSLLSKQALPGVLILTVLSLATPGFAQSRPDQDVLTKKDTRVEPTSWGNVYGRIYDAATGAPLQGVSISVETDDGFLDKGRSVATTDELGGFKAQTVLGRISSNFDVGRALLSSGIGLLLGTATNTTKRIDLAQVNVRAIATGYKPFTGVVSARTQDAAKFRIDLEPILLVKETAPEVSVSATTWSAVRIDDVSAEPALAKKGDKVKLSAQVLAFGKDPARNVELVALSKLWRGERKLSYKKELSTSGKLVFQAEYQVSGKESSHVEPVFFMIKKSTLDYDPSRAGRSALIQIVAGPNEESVAQERITAVDQWRHRQPKDALPLFQRIAAQSSNVFDLRMVAACAESTGDWNTAAEAWLKLASIKGDEAEDLMEFSRTLYLAKNYDKLVTTVEAELAKTKPKDWSKKVPASAVGLLGQSYVKLNQIARATKLNEQLLAWPTSGLEQSVIEFRGALRLAEIQQQHANAPESSDAMADYGRALLDLGRYEEAVSKLQASMEKNPSQQAVKRDLVWAAMQLLDQPPSEPDLVAAVAEARIGLNLDKGKQRSKDFFSWNQYAVLLYALAQQQRAAGMEGAVATEAEAIDALREALTLGRVGARKASGAFSYTFGYMSGSQVAISGFAYPEANSSFLLLDSLKKLRRSPADALATRNEAAALIDLGQTTLAERALARLMALNPDSVDGRFLAALACAKKGDTAEAKRLLEEVATLSPLHPRANVLLSQLLAADGDVAGAAERLAQHAKYYGDRGGS